MHAGAHLGLNFKSAMMVANDDSNEIKIVERYLAVELSPTYFLTKNLSMGIYYLFSHGLYPGTVDHSHFITINASLSNIRLSKKIFMRITPQFYYLNQGDRDGFYFTSVFALNKKNFPLSITSIINKVIQTEIVSDDFVWNVTLMYSFYKQYKRM